VIPFCMDGGPCGGAARPARTALPDGDAAGLAWMAAPATELLASHRCRLRRQRGPPQSDGSPRWRSGFPRVHGGPSGAPRRWPSNAVSPSSLPMALTMAWRQAPSLMQRDFCWIYYR
jgi:hypothetical protein